MDISKIRKQDIISALESIDKNGIPSGLQNDTHYIFYNGKRYPLMYTLEQAMGSNSFEPYITNNEVIILLSELGK